MILLKSARTREKINCDWIMARNEFIDEEYIEMEINKIVKSLENIEEVLQDTFEIRRQVEYYDKKDFDIEDVYSDEILSKIHRANTIIDKIHIMVNQVWI